MITRQKEEHRQSLRLEIDPAFFLRSSFPHACLRIAFNLEFFTDSGDLRQLVRMLESDPLLEKFSKLNCALVDIIEDYPYVGYHTLNIQDKESVLRLLRAIDKSNGYVYVNIDATRWAYQMMLGQPEKDHRYIRDVEERYVKRKE